MHPPMPMLMAVCWSTLVTTMLPLVYLPNVLGARPYGKVYDEFGQRTSLIFAGGYAELENCVKEKINFPDDLDQLGGTIMCLNGKTSLPRTVLHRIAYVTSSSSNAKTCPTENDCSYLHILDKDGVPWICTTHLTAIPKTECGMVTLVLDKLYIDTPTYETDHVDCDGNLVGFGMFWFRPDDVENPDVLLHPGTVILVNKTQSDIIIGAFGNHMSCESPDLNVPQSGSTLLSRVELGRLSEDKLARIYCTQTSNGKHGAAQTYLFVGLNEISIDCSAATGSKCKAPAWMKMRQDNLNEVYENGQVHCSLKINMQLCFPIVTNVTTPNNTAVCTTTGAHATTIRKGSSLAGSGGTTGTTDGGGSTGGRGTAGNVESVPAGGGTMDDIGDGGSTVVGRSGEHSTVHTNKTKEPDELNEKKDTGGGGLPTIAIVGIVGLIVIIIVGVLVIYFAIAKKGHSTAKSIPAKPEDDIQSVQMDKPMQELSSTDAKVVAADGPYGSQKKNGKDDEGQKGQDIQEGQKIQEGQEIQKGQKIQEGHEIQEGKEIHEGQKIQEGQEIQDGQKIPEGQEGQEELEYDSIGSED